MTPSVNVALLSAVPIPTVLIGPDERVVHLNAAGQEILGQVGAGRHYVTVLRQPVLLDGVERALNARETTTTRHQVSHVSGDTIFRVVCAPVDLGSGHGALVSFEDVSHVEDAEQSRRDFVANVSHELRTPLTALMGFIETLRGAAKDDPDARERFLGIMEQEAGRMNRLVKDLLSLSRVEAQQRVRPTEVVELSGLLASAVLSLKPVAVEADVTVELLGTETPCEISGDPDQLVQVFTNLLENAIKYGAHRGGVVTLALERLDHHPSMRGSAVRVEVIDQGDGIDPAHVARLTERFYRIDNHRSRELGGTGLGLAIVKHIVNRHRGRLRIESVPGQGSTFSVVLPVG